MESENFRDVAERIQTGDIVYYSSNEADSWVPAGVVVRLDEDALGADSRFLVVTPEQSVASLGQIAERGEHVRIDFLGASAREQSSARKLRQVVTVEGLLGGFDGLDELLSPDERQLQIESVTVPPEFPPPGGTFGILNFADTCLTCTHMDHAPYVCDRCAPGSICNR